jgi:hypothetical protein
MTQNQALTLVDDAIVFAMSAVGEIAPASVRALMIAASNWCWRCPLGTLISQPLVNAPDEASINHTAS